MSAAALRAEGDSTPASDVTERITKLFPKCRPRTMHKHDRLSSNLENRTELNNINNVSSDDEGCDTDVQRVVLNSKGDPYKLRDSRIIEIAGGREVYTGSRTKATRKQRHNVTHKQNGYNKPRPLASECDYGTDDTQEIPISRLINNEPKTMVSRHTSPTYMNGDCDPTDHTSFGIPKNSSPILDPHKANDVSSKSSPIAVVADGEVMVFDDNEDWKVILNSVSVGLRTEEDASDNEIDSVKRTLDIMHNGLSDVIMNSASLLSEESCDGGSETSSSRDIGSPSGLCEGDDERRVPRVIGELPIADYEGSPRRYGLGTQLTNCHASRSPRPGFPQRVVTESREASPPSGPNAFDYLYEFSETRKVLEEFFRGPNSAAVSHPDDRAHFQDLEYELRRPSLENGHAENGVEESSENEWPPAPDDTLDSPHVTHNHTNFLGLQQHERNRYTASQGRRMVSALSGAAWSGRTSPCDNAPVPMEPAGRLRTDTTLDLMIMASELADLRGISDLSRGVRLPVVEDGLSSGHESDEDNLNEQDTLEVTHTQTHTSVIMDEVVENGTSGSTESQMLSDADLQSLDPLVCEVSPPPPAPAPHRGADPPLDSPGTLGLPVSLESPGLGPPGLLGLPGLLAPPGLSAAGVSLAVTATMKDPPTPTSQTISIVHNSSPFLNNGERPTSAQSSESAEIKPASNEEDEADTDLETDRLLGQQRTDDQGFYDDKGWRKPKSRTVMPGGSVTGLGRSPPHESADAESISKDKEAKKKSKTKEGFDHSVLIEGVLFRARYLGSTQLACEGQPTKATRMIQAEEAVSRIKWADAAGPYSGVYAAPATVFRLSFVGSIEVDEDRRKRKRPKKHMVEEAVTKLKAPEGENQPSTEVDLFISTEKIMVLNTELKEIMMDHALRTISYIADIGDLVVLMARRRFVPNETDSDPPKMNRTPKMICHVFESEEAQFIAQSIGQAFQVAYMEFLKANGIEDHSFVKEMDYQEVLNSQEIFGDELQMFAKKELQKEVVVPKSKGEILGVVVVESGWGSMLPTVVIANLAPAGAAARCGHLNIGDQIIAINGVSLVGLPLSTCQTYIKNSKNQTVVKLTVVPCAPVVEVKIKRPDTKYQLGFSVQNGVICSLLRGGIAERGGVRVGHRIIEINSQSVVAVPHERIVNLLATSVGEILMKTMPTSMFRLLTGQENPVFI